jgi:hypothetical protein
VLAPSGSRTSQPAILRLPAVLDPLTPLATVTFTTPRELGPLTVRLLDGDTVLGQGVTHARTLPSGATAPSLSGITLDLATDVGPWLTGRCSPLRVTVRNGSGALLQAYPRPMALPPETGRTVLDVEILADTRHVRSERAHQWTTWPSLLWHDLAPGDQTTLVAWVEAPAGDGRFTVKGRLGVVTRGHWAEARTHVTVQRAP